MSEGTIPITDKYKIGVDINLPLVRLFKDAAQGLSPKDIMSLVVPAAVGRRVDLKEITSRDESYASYAMSYGAEGNVSYERVMYDFDLSFQKKLAAFIGCSPNNLPLNIPPELTPELLDFLTALHESEHITQSSVMEFYGNKFALFGKESSLGLENGGFCERSFFETLMTEVDADFSEIMYLKEERMDNVAQFLLDMRTIGSFTIKFPKFDMDSLYDHDTAMILNHYMDTGEVFDPEYVCAEKKALIEKVYGELGIKPDWFGRVRSVCGMTATRSPAEEECSAANAVFPKMPPQFIRGALEGLLDKGALEGLQKQEAEAFVAASERVGYEAFPVSLTESYKEAIETLYGNLYGVQFSISDPPVSLGMKDTSFTP